MKQQFLLVIGAALMAAVIPAQAKVSQQTLDNLNTAFQGESNAAHRYEAFAKKADTDGYVQAARLFRAAARAESIHKENHKQAILALGGKIKDFKLDELKVGTTAENLQAAIKGESYASKLLRHLAAGLREAGHVVDCAQDGAEARWAVENGSYEALVVDIMMPQVDGVSLVRGLRRRGVTVPVIFITARGEVRDRVAGLDAGADDYLVKPFALDELLARLRALTRRNRSEVSQMLRVGNLELDLLARAVRRGGENIELTNREFALLELLAQSSPRTVSKSAIVERVWDQHFDGGTNVVNVYINYLRSKIDQPGQPSLIRTVRGIGFALVSAEAK